MRAHFAHTAQRRSYGRRLRGVAHGTAQPIYNKQLGKSRAESVADDLKQKGVKKARTQAESKGEAAAAENNPWHWPLDRRVTIRLQK